MPRFSKAVLVPLLFLATLFGSCGEGLASFPWKSAAGGNLCFTQSASFPRGGEGSFGAGRSANLYVLNEGVRAERGTMVAIEIEVNIDGITARLAVSPERKPKGQGSSFVLPRGRSIVYLNQVGKASRSISASFALSSGGASAQAAGEVWAAIRSIRFAPEFHGLDAGRDGPRRISDDLVIEGSAYGSVWKFSRMLGPSAAAPVSDSRVPALILAWDQRSDADIIISGGSKLRLRAASARKSALVPDSVLGEGKSGTVELAAPSAARLQSAYIESVGTIEAMAVDPGVVLLSPQLGEGADFAYRAWDLLPAVLIFDFRDYATQDAYLKRLAFFVEKRGFAGRLASDTEIASLHGWNAHDYRAEDLAAFFTTAAETSFRLNQKEEALRDFLVAQHVIARKGGGYGGGGGAIISISQESPAYLRRLFLTHESSHALFFVDEGYRQLATSLWDSMSREERWFWKLYFGWMNYDTGSSYLMASEVQAYLVQQPVAGATKYFNVTLPARLLEKHPELGPELKSYFERFGGEFTAKATILDTWLRKTYGFGAGTTLFLR